MIKQRILIQNTDCNRCKELAQAGNAYWNEIERLDKELNETKAELQKYKDFIQTMYKLATGGRPG